MELVCMEHGSGAVFPVAIARDANVMDLKAAIFNAKRYNHRYLFGASALRLYLTRINNGDSRHWLKNADDDYLETVARQQQRASHEFVEMQHVTWKLNQLEYFGPDFEPRDEEIHVLVGLPESPTLRAIGSRAIQRTKRKRLERSALDTSQGRAILRALRIRVEPVRAVVPADWQNQMLSPVEPFLWEHVLDERDQCVARTEEQQRERYRVYVEQNIGDVLTKQRLCVLGVDRQHENILTTTIPGRGIQLGGHTDLLILSDLARDFPIHLQWLPDIKMSIRVKRGVAEDDVFQAVVALVVLEILAHGEPVVVLLTDLAGHWQFFWVSERRDDNTMIQTLILSDPTAAFAAILSLLHTNGVDFVGRPSSDISVKRFKLAK